MASPDEIDLYSLATFGKAIFIRISSIIMKKSEIVEGCCYKLAPVIENLDFIKKEIDSGHLLKNKGRPYMVVFCNFVIKKIALFG
ncbi:hypothetical protein [Ruminococcus bicirculans (ex Wegman et al. 2014)]|uniref:hypothetical protein n=1 Tax=Ruminococcus bicirculans (ex Wegman et al. 2014) TaxID=1160721 RepID=UPI0026739D92